MTTTRGFGRIDLVAKAIRELYRSFGVKHLRLFEQNFILDPVAVGIVSDPIIGTQRLATRIVEHYHLPVTTVIVVFSQALPVPGRVELGKGNEFLVELQTALKSTPKAIAAILAHEVAHIFLHRCGVRFAVEIENEVLTDTAAVYAGFGPTIMNAATEMRTRIDGRTIHTRTQHLGYLSMDEFGYVLANRDRLHGANSRTLLDPGLALETFREGRWKYYRDFKRRPYLPRSIFDRLIRRLFPKIAFGDKESTITFQCPLCFQSLRVRTMFKPVHVHCSSCELRFECFA